jgi:insulysin
VLYFIEKIQKIGANQSFFEELQVITKLDFDYIEKDDPYNYVTDISHNLSLYDTEDILTGPYLLEIYDPDAIKKYLDMLTTKNLNIYLTSKNLEKTEGLETWLTERWYGTKYKKDKFVFDGIFEEINKKLESSETIRDRYERLGYPPSNNHIPKSFDLISNKPDLTYPQKYYSDEKCTIWYKPDTKFNVPRLFLGAQIYLNVDKLGFPYLEYRTYSKLWNEIYNNYLQEKLYMGKVAKIHYNFHFNHSGIYFEVSGFNDSLERYTKEILDDYIQFINNFIADPSKFKNVIQTSLEYMTQNNKNYFLASSSTQVSSNLHKFLSKPHIDKHDEGILLQTIKLNLENNDFDFISKFVSTHLSQSYFEWLIQGNFNISQTIHLIEHIQNRLQRNPLPECDFFDYDVAKLPIYNYCYQFQSQDKENDNSAIISYFQFGNLSEVDKCKLLVIENALQESFFDDLRTQQSLGYFVNLSIYNHNRVDGITCTIQSNVESPEYIYKQINLFFDDYHLEELEDTEFKEYITSVITNLKKKHLTIGDEFDCHYGEIELREYKFERNLERIKILEQLSKEEVVEFFEEYLINNTRRIDIELISEKHLMDNKKHEQDNIALNRKIVQTNEEFKAFCEFYNFKII